MSIKIPDLVKKLELGTKNRKLTWVPTSRDSEYRLKLGDGSITIDSWNNGGNGSSDIAFFNPQGEQVDRYAYIEGVHPEFYLIDSLQKIIRRTMLRADETIAGILDNLDESLKD